MNKFEIMFFVVMFIGLIISVFATMSNPDLWMFPVSIAVTMINCWYLSSRLSCLQAEIEVQEQ